MLTASIGILAPDLESLVLTIYPRVVSELGTSEVSLDDAFGDLKIHHVATNLHCARAATATVTCSEASIQPNVSSI
jgi:hypothetical protein